MTPQEKAISDNLKREYCQNNGIKFIEISYKDFNNIKQILKEKICE